MECYDAGTEKNNRFHGVYQDNECLEPIVTLDYTNT